jgi:hypothetical protein
LVVNMALMAVLVIQSVIIWTLTGMLEDSAEDKDEPPKGAKPKRLKNQLRTAQERYEKSKNDIL